MTPIEPMAYYSIYTKNRGGVLSKQQSNAFAVIHQNNASVRTPESVVYSESHSVVSKRTTTSPIYSIDQSEDE